ncbi:MAG: hypothetical protein Q9173_005280 [Seirophora scorigena]
MAKEQLPNERLVYVHCSPIFRGQDAKIRQSKAVNRRLTANQTSISNLKRDFSLSAIATVVKRLLDDRIFESPSLAQLRFPTPPKAKELEPNATALKATASNVTASSVMAPKATASKVTASNLAASQATSSKAEAVSGEAKVIEKERPTAVTEDLKRSPEPGRPHKVQQCGSPSSSSRDISPVNSRITAYPGPIHLLFRTQHQLLVKVQTLLEECCFNFGKMWVPIEMEVLGWHETEAVELTQWTERFLGSISPSLPPSAIKPITGTSMPEVVRRTSRLRHAAVHRLPASPAELVEILGAAVSLAEALDGSEQAQKIARIKEQAENCMQEITQHQSLLERKLTDQLEDLSRRRAELDEVERLYRAEVAASSRKKRTEVGSTLEAVFNGCQRVYPTCGCIHGRCTDRHEKKVDMKGNQKPDSTIGLCTKSAPTVSHPSSNPPRAIALEGEREISDSANALQNRDQDIPSGKVFTSSEGSNEDLDDGRYSLSRSSSEADSGVSILPLPTQASEGRSQTEKEIAALAQDVPATEDESFSAHGNSHPDEASCASAHAVGSTSGEDFSQRLECPEPDGVVPAGPRKRSEEASLVKESRFAQNLAPWESDSYAMSSWEDYLPEDTPPIQQKRKAATCPQEEDEEEEDRPVLNTSTGTSRAETVIGSPSSTAEGLPKGNSGFFK